ncbi:MAG: hypothetical protein HYY04_04610 [Chloroflexi bacterium]|nr:hypothetical protein [Chloroflexota bacterium]
MHKDRAFRLKLVGLNVLVAAAMALAACVPAAVETPTPARTPVARTPVAVTPGRTPAAVMTPAAVAARVFTLNQVGRSITVFDPTTMKAVERIDLGFTPGNLAVSPDGRFAWLTHAAISPAAAVTPGAATPVTTPVTAMTPTPGAATPAAGLTPTPGVATPMATPAALTPTAPTALTPVGTPAAALTPAAAAVSNLVTVFDLTIRQKVADIRTSGAPDEIVVSADGRWAFVSDRVGDFLTVIDATRYTETQRISLGEKAQGMEFVRIAARAATPVAGATPPAAATPAALTPSALTPTPAATPAAALTPGATPSPMLTPVAGVMRELLYVTLPRAGAVAVIDPNTLKEVTRVRITTAGVAGPTDVFASPTGNRIFVTGGQMTQVAVIDPATNQVSKTIDLANVTPVTGVASPTGDMLFLVTPTGNQLLTVDVGTGQIGKQIRVGQDPRSVTITPDGRRVLVANRGDNSISVIDASTQAVIDTVQVGEGPTEIAWPEGALGGT